MYDEDNGYYQRSKSLDLSVRIVEGRGLDGVREAIEGARLLDGYKNGTDQPKANVVAVAEKTDAPETMTITAEPAASNVVTLASATSAFDAPFSDDELPVEAAPAERKKPGRKPKAAKKAKATRKARQAETTENLSDTRTASDAPVANGSGEHVEVPVTETQAEQPMAA